MANKNPLQKCFLFITFLLQALASEISNKKTYVIHMDKSAMPLPYSDHLQWYSSKINSITERNSDEDDEENRILYTYQTAFHGLAARLSETEAKYELHTTRSPTFLGLEKQESERVWPESESFNDTGMSPIPSTWRGACETG